MNTTLERAETILHKPRFAPHTPLRAELNQAVDAYFERTGLERTGEGKMVLKSCIIFTWAALSYGFLLLWASTWWQAGLLCVSLGLALAGVGFSVMHDGNHGSYSRRRWLGKLAGGAIDLLGGSAYVWIQKHNVLHHTYTNIDGYDDDIEIKPFLRMAEGHPRYWFHRFQWFYWVPLFTFFTTKWVLVDDFLSLATGKVGGHPFARPKGWDLVQLLAGKVSFVIYAIVIPLNFIPVVPYVIGYFFTSTVWGVTMGMVFQLAHAVETVDFEDAAVTEQYQPWVEHQLATTTDFARNNPFLTWYLGGLNFQVEHHLYPRISHLHYPALSEIVREVAGRHGITPHDFPSLSSALLSHLRYLYRMGHPAPVSAAA
jgi:linoleoyl-CoA desaturase